LVFILGIWLVLSRTSRPAGSGRIAATFLGADCPEACLAVPDGGFKASRTATACPAGRLNGLVIVEKAGL
jgi:hypothetical protein